MLLKPNAATVYINTTVKNNPNKTVKTSDTSFCDTNLKTEDNGGGCSKHRALSFPVSLCTSIILDILVSRIHLHIEWFILI